MVKLFVKISTVRVSASTTRVHKVSWYGTYSQYSTRDTVEEIYVFYNDEFYP